MARPCHEPGLRRRRCLQVRQTPRLRSRPVCFSPGVSNCLMGLDIDSKSQRIPISEIVLLTSDSSMSADPATVTETLKREWTDQLVLVNPQRPELKRFEGIVGRVVTVNWGNKALVD